MGSHTDYQSKDKRMEMFLIAYLWWRLGVVLFIEYQIFLNLWKPATHNLDLDQNFRIRYHVAGHSQPRSDHLLGRFRLRMVIKNDNHSKLTPRLRFFFFRFQNFRILSKVWVNQDSWAYTKQGGTQSFGLYYCSWRTWSTLSSGASRHLRT